MLSTVYCTYSITRLTSISYSEFYETTGDVVDRVRFVSRILESRPPVSAVLDVGCRDGSLADFLPSSTTYFGADLFQNERENVAYLGDIQSVVFDRKFEQVVALDILEHVDDLHGLFDKLIGITETCLIVSMPNCFDLKSRLNFFFKGTLGGKYRLGGLPSLDRHRWLVSDSDVISFFESKAESYNFKLTTHRMRYGDWASPSLVSRLRACSRFVLPDQLATATVFGVFSK